MRDLFVMDAKDYKEDGKIFRRPSARAIIERGGKVLLIYSQKYNYYKFPGGGIKKGESPEEALIREVKEESGYSVIPGSVRDYGRVLRRHKDSFDCEGIFEQENLYYLCEISEEKGEASLDDYEAEEGFTAVWSLPFDASICNHYTLRAGGYPDPEMLIREEKVLVMVDKELLRRERRAKEAEAIRALGSLDYAGMLDFVEKAMSRAVTTERIESKKSDIPYSRFEHTKRVLMWTKRLYDMSKNKNELRYEDLMIAAIFHDVGRSVSDQTGVPHAAAGVPITKEYLTDHGFDAARADYIGFLVGAHSDKYRMKEPDADKNLIMLMEADLMDDMGALGIVMDCMITESRSHEATFADCLDHITRYTLRQQQVNPMVSEAARKIWDEKTRIAEEFTEALRRDLVF